MQQNSFLQDSSLGLQNSSPELQNSPSDIATKGAILEFRGAILPSKGAILPGGYFAAQNLVVLMVQYHGNRVKNMDSRTKVKVEIVI